MKLDAYLRGLGACPESIRWAKGREVGERAWLDCPEPSWMVWIAVVVGVPAKTIDRILAHVCDEVAVTHGLYRFIQCRESREKYRLYGDYYNAAMCIYHSRIEKGRATEIFRLHLPYSTLKDYLG